MRQMMHSTADKAISRRHYQRDGRRVTRTDDNKDKPPVFSPPLLLMAPACSKPSVSYRAGTGV